MKNQPCPWGIEARNKAERGEINFTIESERPTYCTCINCTGTIEAARGRNCLYFPHKQKNLKPEKKPRQVRNSKFLMGSGARV